VFPDYAVINRNASTAYIGIYPNLKTSHRDYDYYERNVRNSHSAFYSWLMESRWHKWSQVVMVMFGLPLTVRLKLDLSINSIDIRYA